MKLWIAAIIVFVFNVPFGYWRANVKKFSLGWVLSIHVPVPFVIALRLLSGLGFAFITYPVLVGAFFLGQFSGKKLSVRLDKLNYFNVSSCLPCDFKKYLVRNAAEKI